MSLFKIESVYFDEVKVISSTVFADQRGYFSPSFRKDEFKALGLPYEFVQDNRSYSVRNVVRGLHFQLHPAMGKLMRVVRGTAYMVAVDLRENSPTFLQWCGVEVSGENQLQVWAPAYFARGFCAVSSELEVQYKCTDYFDAKGDAAVRWNDPDIGVDWPVKEPILSTRDKLAPSVRKYLGEIACVK